MTEVEEELLQHLAPWCRKLVLLLQEVQVPPTDRSKNLMMGTMHEDHDPCYLGRHRKAYDYLTMIMKKK